MCFDFWLQELNLAHNFKNGHAEIIMGYNQTIGTKTKIYILYILDNILMYNIDSTV